MSIWGKIIGGAAGLALGGPLGALLGAAAGHVMYDRRARDLQGLYADDGGGPGLEDAQLSFLLGFIALAAKVAKADGRVTRDEVAAMKSVVDIPEDVEAMVRDVFNEAKKDAEGYEPYARQVAQLLNYKRAVLEDMLGALVMISHADGVYSPAERACIAGIARVFRLRESDVRRIERMFVMDGADAGGDPYEILGVSPDAGDREVKGAYRAFLKDNHPDKVRAQGLPEEFVEVANRKVAEVNAAYDRIKRERDLS